MTVRSWSGFGVLVPAPHTDTFRNAAGRTSRDTLEVPGAPAVPVGAQKECPGLRGFSGGWGLGWSFTLPGSQQATCPQAL